MFTFKMARFIAGLLMLGAFVAPISPIPAQAQRAPDKAQAERLILQKIKQAPDSEVIESEGKRITVGELRAMQAARAKAAEATFMEERKQVETKLKTMQMKLAEERKSQLEAQNAKLKMEFARLRQRDEAIDKIQKEAIQLHNRAKTASPAEKAKIDKRANELVGELQKLGVQ